MKKVYTKIKKLETNKQNTLRGDTAYRCYEQMFEGKAFWQQPFDPQKDMDIRLPYDLGTGRKFYGYNLTQLLSYKKPEDKFIPLRYITYKDAQNKGYYIKKGSKSIALENYSKYDMGYAKEQSPNNKTYTKFYKNKTNNWHTYENNIFSEQMLQGKHQFFYPENEIDAIEYIKNIAYNMNMKIIEDSHNNIGFYSIKKDEIHMPTKDRFNDEREYYSELLRHLIKAATKPGRVNQKGMEGYGIDSKNIRYVKDRFRIELCRMQICLGLKLPYKPSMTLLENKQIGGLITKFPNYLVFMSNDAYSLMKYINKQSIYRAKNLEEFITYHVKQGKLSEKELKDLCIAYNFKEIKDLPDIKKRQIINMITLKQEQTLSNNENKIDTNKLTIIQNFKPKANSISTTQLYLKMAQNLLKEHDNIWQQDFNKKIVSELQNKGKNIFDIKQAIMKYSPVNMPAEELKNITKLSQNKSLSK